ncbi:hypothetical protein [Streptomyces filamentosus]|uniref:hypothetical protein n=1 Tax=Streptomyces filamentosus TaxID=67294 RepID=UPI00123BA86B|nr:hypothetical protein [Streptomyces filamentosus]KAA6219051.1 hypothetical protein CP979_20825 [Streptomyces filamentosus]
MSARPRALRAALALAASVALSLGAAAPAVSAAPRTPAAGGEHGWPHPDLATSYEATKKYRSEEKAVADGFERTEVCVEDTSGANLGGMGYHYVNPADIGSTDPARPAAVIYAEEHGSGKRRLVALEWVVPDAGQPVPRAFGRDFDGPEPIPGLGEVYSLHAWIHEENPAGVFAPYNPRVHCGPCPEK